MTFEPIRRRDGILDGYPCHYCGERVWGSPELRPREEGQPYLFNIEPSRKYLVAHCACYEKEHSEDLLHPE